MISLNWSLLLTLQILLNDIAQLEFVTDPANLASKGYALNSMRVSGGKKQSSVGLDIGNALSVVSRLSE